MLVSASALLQSAFEEDGRVAQSYGLAFRGGVDGVHVVWVAVAAVVFGGWEVGLGGGEGWSGGFVGHVMGWRGGVEARRKMRGSVHGWADC